jgi:hypothetical protein
MKTNVLIALITTIAIIISIIITTVLFMEKLRVIESQRAYGDSGNGLKVIVKIKYSDFIKEHGICKA